MKSYKHKVLVANPAITDPIFAGSIVFLFGHTRDGAQGVILNPRNVKKLGFAQLNGDEISSADEAVDELKKMVKNDNIETAPLYIGGPIKTPGIYFLHGYEEFKNPFEEKSEFDLGIPDSFEVYDNEDDDKPYKENYPSSPFGEGVDAEVIDGVYFGTPGTFIQILEDSDKKEENRFRFFIGQAGWGAGQLEQEVKSGAWSVREATSDLFFDESAQKKLVAEVTREFEDSEEEPVKKKDDEWPWSWLTSKPPGYDSSRN